MESSSANQRTSGIAAEALGRSGSGSGTAVGYGVPFAGRREGTRCSQKILIANRGEIAVRVMRTCRELGIATVAVYSDLDRDALHVRYADEAYALGGQTAAESYLNTDAILDAIEQRGADGVHPGYGFFSENADFAARDHRRGRRVDRPAARSDRDHGRQDLVAEGRRARPRSRRCPARSSRSPTSSEIVAFGERVRLAGRDQGRVRRRRQGHEGRGQTPTKPRAAFDSATREAQAYFGRSECYLERYLTRPRHVEMQVFADTHGNGVYLGDRDCSTQRRHQKLIEEAPAPALPDETRARDGRGRGEGRGSRAAT